jgi:hypothetical protein
MRPFVRTDAAWVESAHAEPAGTAIAPLFNSAGGGVHAAVA